MAVVKKYLTTEPERLAADREDMKELGRGKKKLGGVNDE